MKNDENKKINMYKYIIPTLLIVIVLLLIIILLVLWNQAEDNLKSVNDRVGENSTINSEINDNNSLKENNSTSNNYISKQEALNISLKDIGISQDNIRDLDLELDYKYGKTVYEISFNYKQFEYEYYIDAENGEIIHSFKEID